MKTVQAELQELGVVNAASAEQVREKCIEIALGKVGKIWTDEWQWSTDWINDRLRKLVTIAVDETLKAEI